MRWKSRFRWVHLALAAAAGLPMLVVSVTGALLVFPESSRRLMTGVDLRTQPGPALPPSRLIASAASALPAGERIDRLVYPKVPGDVLRVEADRHVVALEPTTGRVVRIEATGRDFVRVVTDLHVHLMAGEVGEWVVGLSSVALMALCLSGLRLWWPVGRWTSAYFLVKLRGGPKRANFDLHRAAGLYAGAFLFVIALTGATMAFHGVVAPIAYLATGSRPGPRPPREWPRRTGGEVLSPDRILALALERHPGHEPRRLYPPAGPTKPYRVFLDPPGEHETRRREVRLTLDPSTGAVLHEEGPATISRGDALLRWVLPLHFGTFGGTATKLAYLAACLTPPLLAWTGGVLWWNRRRKRTGSALRRPAAELAAAGPDAPG